jgi:hypothetical protein
MKLCLMIEGQEGVTWLACLLAATRASWRRGWPEPRGQAPAATGTAGLERRQLPARGPTATEGAETDGVTCGVT